MVYVPPRDRVLEYSTSNSQSVFAVTGAADPSYNAFSAFMAVGDTTIGGVVEQGVAFKSGILTCTASNQLTLSTVFESKGVFSAAGSKQVFMGLPAQSALNLDGPQTLSAAKKTQGQINLGVREVLTANRDYYVRTDGNDSNTGLSNTAGGAFLTIQAAINAACALDLSIYFVRINIANGTYNGALIAKTYVGVGPIYLIGNAASPSSVVINNGGGGWAAFYNNSGRTYSLNGFKFTASGSNSHAFSAFNGGSIIQFANIDFGACGAYHMWINNGGFIGWNGGTYAITGAANYHLLMSQCGMADFRGATINIPSGVAFASAFVQVSYGSNILANGVTFSGAGVASVTGKRYNVTTQSTIDTAGGGASYFPGSIAGTATGTGEYL
jgi:hypothetical protein